MLVKSILSFGLWWILAALSQLLLIVSVFVLEELASHKCSARPRRWRWSDAIGRDPVESENLVY